MIFKKLELNNFRKIKSAKLELHKGINIFYGDNAAGKTSILEALWSFTGAKSFRGSKDTDLISFGSEKASVKLSFLDNEREQECIINIEKHREAILNDVEYGPASKIAGKINAIVFSPIDLNIIENGPAFRRKFLDTAICQLYPSYLDIYKKYLRAVEQRNKILKDIKYNPMLLEFLEDFENEISSFGAQIIDYREKFIEMLNKYLPNIYNSISLGKEKIEIFYETDASKQKEKFKEKLKLLRDEDIKNISTSIGPHRDDIDIKIDSISARYFGSQGQKRSAAIALKLSESEVIYEITGKKPVALLDDVMSELDTNRQNYILNHIKDWQVFITCCDKENFSSLKEGKIFEVKNGEIFS